MENNNQIKQLAKDFARYKELKNQLNPNNDMFIEVENTPEWKEFSELSKKVAPYVKYGIFKDNDTLSKEIDNALNDLFDELSDLES